MTIRLSDLPAAVRAQLPSRGRGGARPSGSSWQHEIERSAKLSDAVTLFRIPNGAKWIGPGKTVPVKSPFDYGGCVGIVQDERYVIRSNLDPSRVVSVVPGPIGAAGRGIFFDAKSLGAKYASCPLDNESMFEPHQLMHLAALAESGALAGLLVRAERCQEILWLDARLICQPVQERFSWFDHRWLRLGPIGRPVDFSKLVREAK